MSKNIVPIRNILGGFLTVLLVAQLFLLPLIPALTGSDYDLYAKFVYIYLIVSYSAILTMTLLERNYLHEFHIDNKSLWLFVFSCFIRRRLGIPYEIYYLLPIMLCGIIGALHAIFHRTHLPKTNPKSMFGGIIVGLVVVFISALFEFTQSQQWLDSIYTSNLTLYFIRELVFQLSFVVLIEEFIFRGFLFGYLEKLGLQSQAASVGQAILFWMLHYTRIGSPITFFISIPLLTLATSFVAKRYKQIFPSIIVHVTVNTLTPLIIYFLNL